MNEKNINQIKLAKELNIKQPVISRLLTDDKQTEATAALKYSLLKVYGYDIESNKYINSGQPQYPDDVIALPYYTDSQAAAGTGENVVDEEVKEHLFFDKRWLRAVIGRNADNLSLIRANGNSMLPHIKDGDLLMVDNSIKEIIPNKVFVIYQENKLRVKRLKSEFNGDILVLSDNPEYPTEIMDKETIIIGQVVWNGSKENL